MYYENSFNNYNPVMSLDEFDRIVYVDYNRPHDGSCSIIAEFVLRGDDRAFYVRSVEFENDNEFIDLMNWLVDGFEGIVEDNESRHFFYMCKVDHDYHLPYDRLGVKLYPSIFALIDAKPCVSECGIEIVRVESCGTAIPEFFEKD